MRNKKYIYVISVLIIVIFSGTGLYLINTVKKEDNNFNPFIIQDTETPITGENIYLEVIQIPIESNVTWFFNENITKYGLKTSIIYHISDAYDVKCLIRNNGIEAKANITLHVKNANNYDFRSNRMLVSNLRGPSWDVEGSDIFPGITQPIVRIKISIQNVIGKLGIQIRFDDYQGGGSNIFEETYVCINEDIEFDNEFSYPTLPDIVHESGILAYIRLDNGKTGAYEIEIWVMY